MPRPRAEAAPGGSGATLVQLYTGLIYEGPALIRAAAEAFGAARFPQRGGRPDRRPGRARMRGFPLKSY